MRNHGRTTLLTTGIVKLQRIREEKLLFARSKRCNPTRAEDLLWQRLRRKQVCGMKFRRQQIIEGFVADFFCEKARLVVEADGEYHQRPEQQEEDERRTEVFHTRGLMELRFENTKIVADIEGVVKQIEECVHARTSPPIPLPPEGGG